MSSAGAVAIQSARLSQMGVNRQVLKEGSRVLVRVIADRGNGKYEGSVAGVRVQLNSAKALTPGNSFVATVSVKNGTIVISPKEAGLLSAENGEISLSFNEVSQTELASLLESLGLPADNLSSSILKSFKQMGIKMDSALANKIRSLALRFAGKEKSAAEIISLLAQKGLEADEDEIRQLLSLLENKEEADAESQGKDKRAKELINKINNKDGAWYLLPFELIQLNKTDTEGQRKTLGKGCIRLLFDSAKVLKRMNLDCNYNNQKYLFSLAYEGNKITSTSFNVGGLAVSEEDIQTQIISLKRHFMAADLNPETVNWTEKENLEGNASGLESFISFGGQI